MLSLFEIFIAIAAALTGFAANNILSEGLFKRVLRKTALIKFYWKFVIFFALFSTLVYLGIFIVVPLTHIDTALTLVGQVLTLVFAIFVGWYAFLQVAENRIDKLEEKAGELFADGQYQRARQAYEEIYTTNPKNFTNFAGLMELLLVTGDEIEFKRLCSSFEKTCIEDREKLIAKYLDILKDLLSENIKSAKSKLTRCVEFIKSHPQSLSKLGWQFKELRDSAIYQSLEGDSKIILDNFLKYLNLELAVEQRSKFEEGNFRLI
jgi:hypothetical protein